MKDQLIQCLILGSLAAISLNASAQPVDALKPNEDVLDYHSSIFKDMGIVQRQAMRKANRFLLSTNFSADFSSGPYTNYVMQVNPGYALNNFWEVYLNLGPFFISNPRSIVEKVESLELVGNQQATIEYNKPKYMIGFELLWSPLYGKDSLGFRNLVRSDTFFKGGYSYVAYNGDSGSRFHIGFGKTYFLTHTLGFRATIVANFVQTIVDRQKAFNLLGALEVGFNFYF